MANIRIRTAPKARQIKATPKKAAVANTKKNIAKSAAKVAAAKSAQTKTVAANKKYVMAKKTAVVPKAAPQKPAAQKKKSVNPTKATETKKTAKAEVKKVAGNKKPAPEKKPVAAAKKSAAKTVKTASAAANKKAVVAKTPVAKKPEPVKKTAAKTKRISYKAGKKPEPAPVAEGTGKNSERPIPVQRPPFQPVPTLAQTQRAAREKQRFSPQELEQFRADLLARRAEITARSKAMRNDALQGMDDINPEEDGTDAFLRLQTLDQVRDQHEQIAKIDTALRAINDGTYGICCNCGELIRPARLKELPFAKHCINCQSELEKQRFGRKR